MTSIRSTPYRQRIAAALLLSCFSLAACEPATKEPVAFSADAAIRVDLPELGRQEPATRERISRLHANAVATLDRVPLDSGSVAKSFGELGAHLTAVGLFESAADCFENARRAAPNTFRWHFYLGVARHEDSKPEQAADAYATALEIQPDDLPARLHRIDALIDLDRLDEAASELNVALTQLGDGASAHAAVQFALARVAADQGRHADAIEHFERTLELQPDADAAHYPLSQAYLRLGDRDRAQHHLGLRDQDRRPTFDDPLVDELGTLVSLTSLEVVRSRVTQQDFDPVADLGFALAKLGDIGGATERMEQILKTDTALQAVPSHESRFRFLVAGLWVNRDRDDRAEEHFRRALELDGSFTSARLKLANLLGRRGMFNEAVEQYSAVLELETDNGDARIKRAAAFNRLGRNRDALADLRLAYDNAETRAQAAPLLAEILAQLGRPKEAEDVLQSALVATDRPEEQATLHKAVADRHKALGRFDEAVDEYRKALALRPDLAAASLEMASVLGHLGRFDEALVAYGDVLSQEPKSVVARRGEVTALLLTGRYRQAADSLDAALSTFPDASSTEHLEWSHALARLLAACPDSSVRDGARSIRLADRVFDAQPSLRRAETLAMAHAERGDFEQASTIQRNLVQEAQRAGRQGTVARLQQRLKLYDSRQAFRATDIDDLIVSAPNKSERPR